jgi:hypothetical protein
VKASISFLSVLGVLGGSLKKEIFTTQIRFGNISVLQMYPESSPLSKATVYTQVLELPHPNPPLGKGRELDLLFPRNTSWGLRGETRFLLPLLTKERVGVRFKELSTLIEMLPIRLLYHLHFL